MARELRQGEILTNVTHHSHALDADGRPGLTARRVGYVVVATQDCDLFKDFKSRVGGASGIISGALLFEAEDAPKAKDRMKIGGKEWKPIANNTVERFHYLLAGSSETDLTDAALPELLVDFRRYFTVLPAEIERQIEAGAACRRSRLNRPFRDHLQNRAAFFLQRVALPDDYNS
jgi:hypothetical protein